jgi:hypothetical protein
MTDRHGDRNPAWVGDAASYFARHGRVKRARGSASRYICHFCITKMATDWAQLSNTDGLNPYKDYIPSCRSCHLSYDRVGENNGHVTRTSYAHGENHGSSKLTPEQIIAIRDAYSKGERITDISRRYPVSFNAIRKIVDRVTWTHI